jgi:transcriptional regulator with XRE-family HTH domain
MSTPLPWPAQLTSIAGAEIKRHRTARKMSAEELAKKVTSLGYDYSRDQIVNLERTKTRRTSITLGEAIAFGAALGVPPAMLLFPVEGGDIEILPGRNVDAWHAYSWFTGLGASTLTDDIAEQIDEVALKLNAYRNHDNAVLELSLIASTSCEDPDEAETQRRRFADKLETLLARRDAIRARGWEPPRVPLDIKRQVEEAEKGSQR